MHSAFTISVALVLTSNVVDALVNSFNFRKWDTNLTSLFIENFNAIQHDDAASWLQLGVAMYTHSENQVGWASLKSHALQSLNRAISLATLNPDIILQAKMWRGILFRSMSRLDDALKSFQDAAELNVHYFNDTRELENSIAQQANTLTFLGRLSEAVAKYKLLLSLNPKYKLSIYLPLVSCLEEIGNFTDWAQLRQEIEFELNEQEAVYGVEGKLIFEGGLDQSSSIIPMTAEIQARLNYRASAYFALFKV